MEQQPRILIIGGADTGRAPMAAALLRRLLEGAGLPWLVESAGVTGHDDDPAEPEARNAMVAAGLDIQEHRARSLTDEMAAAAALLIAVDRGIAHVLRLRFAHLARRLVTLSELAGRQRDIPDPFRMQIGAWIGYAREIETMLQTGLDRLIALVQETASPEPGSAAGQQPVAAPFGHTSASRSAPIERCERLLTMLIDMPSLIDWPQTQRQLAEDLQAAGSVPLRADDLVQAYTSLLVALLGRLSAAPTREQATALRSAISRLHTAVDGPAITELSSLLGRMLS